MATFISQGLKHGYEYVAVPRDKFTRMEEAFNRPKPPVLPAVAELDRRKREVDQILDDPSIPSSQKIHEHDQAHRRHMMAYDQMVRPKSLAIPSGASSQAKSKGRARRFDQFMDAFIDEFRARSQVPPPTPVEAPFETPFETYMPAPKAPLADSESDGDSTFDHYEEDDIDSDGYQNLTTSSEVQGKPSVVRGWDKEPRDSRF